MLEVTMSSFKIKNDMDGKQATGPRQLTKAFSDVRGRVIVIGINTEDYTVKGYYNHHIDNGVLIGMGKDDIVDVVRKLKDKHGANACMTIVRSDEWLEPEKSMLNDYPYLLVDLVDEINQVANRARSLMCENEDCCPKLGWEIV